MFNRFRGMLSDFFQQADLVLLGLCCGATLFGMVLGTIYLLSKHDIRVNSVTHMLANMGILWLVPS